MSDNYKQNQDKIDGVNSKANLINGGGFFENSLLPSNELLNKKDNNNDKDLLDTSVKKISSKKIKSESDSPKNNSGTSSKRNKKTNKGDMDSNSANRSLLIFDDKKYEEKKSKSGKTIKKQKRYIVDNIDNIFSKLNEPKVKLIFQEMLLYTIVFMVTVYHWIFLFISRSKIERNYCFGRLYQFDSCSTNQICSEYKDKLNLILYNDTFEINNSSMNSHELFVEENKLINIYYKPFFLRYSHQLSTNKLFSKIQMHSNSNDKTNFVIILTTREKWNLFYRNFSLCEYDNYYIIFVIMIALGGIVGSIFFGYVSDLYGRRSVIRVTLFIITFTNIVLAVLSKSLDYYYYKIYEEYNEKNEISGADFSFPIIISQLYAQERIREQFRKAFNLFALDIFILSAGLWPLLKSCMALLIENATGELKVLIGFRRYNFAFGGLPPLFASLIFVNINDFTLSFIILSVLNLFLFIFSVFFLEESARYYYEYCDWPALTEVVLNTYKNNIEDFRTLSDEELREFRKEENLKNFNNSARKNNLFIKNENINNSFYIIKNTYYNELREKNNTLMRNIKRDTDFIIKLDDVKSNPLIIAICLISNRSLITSKYLILIVLILLYILMNLIQKELVDSPYFSTKDFYFGFDNNFILNSTFTYLLIINLASNYFFYMFYRINCFKTIIFGSLIYISMALLLYHILTLNGEDTPIDLNQYNFSMLSIYQKDKISKNLLFLLFTIYFFLNGVNFYVYLLILKISKTIYRCTYFSIHSISLICAFVISESVHGQMSHHFLFLCVLDLLCLMTFSFLSEFKELLYVINDLKIDIFRASKNREEIKEKNE